MSIEDLVASLVKFGQHPRSCYFHFGPFDACGCNAGGYHSKPCPLAGPRVCSCGLDDAIERGRALVEGSASEYGELPPSTLRRISEKLRFVPGTYNIGDEDIDQLLEIASDLDPRKD